VNQDSSLGLIERAHAYDDSIAVRDPGGDFSYAQLLDDSRALAEVLLDGSSDLFGVAVAFLWEPGYGYVVTMWAIWRAGGIAVPLAISHPTAELAYALDHTLAAIVVVDARLRDRVEGLAADRGLRMVTPTGGSFGRVSTAPSRGLPTVSRDHRAIIFFTSGTTGRSKGVVWTHRTVQAQAEMLEAAWGWSSNDTILSVLPLHHIHGVINVLATALWAGATCDIVPRFEAASTWEGLAGGRITVFMAVPTIYVKLIRTWQEAPRETQTRWSAGAARLRLMVSGSAALPVTTLAQWEEITTQRLLERYGMTELGMALSNPLVGDRVSGSVGRPLPGVQVRLADDALSDVEPGTPGEILVRGPGMFLEYWNDPDATRDAFVDGWFRTGDVAVVEDGHYRILGRNSVDIIKTGGYKVSALEIEEAIREHPGIDDCAVIGLPDDEWGQRVAVAIVRVTSATTSLADLRTWLADRLAPYKLPSRLVSVRELPRNSMGKVPKSDVARLFERASDA
jgi:malonyl-CoA/methylmalonyl-CoA synthetase